MRLSYRLILSLIAGVTAVSSIFAVYQAGAEVRTLRDEVQREALVLADSQERAVEPLLEQGSSRDLQAVVNRFQNHERMAGMAVYDTNGQPLAITPGPTSRLGATPAAVRLALRGGWGRGESFRLGDEPMHVFALPVRAKSGGVIGAIAIFHDVAYMDSRR